MSMYHVDMGKETISRRIVDFISNKGGYARMKELKEASFKTADIKKLVAERILDKIKPGLYRISDLEYPADISLGFVDISKAIPRGVICLISALSHYELTTFNPSEIYVAIPNERYAPHIIYPPAVVFYFRDRFYKPGIEIVDTIYGKVRIYNREKTICDMFRYRNKLGEDLAIEGLKNYINYKHADLYQLRRFAEICRVKTIMLPYLKALVG
jgi:predicted transcriptional regulator of viral defense system